MTCAKPLYEQPQEPNVYPVIIDGYRAESLVKSIPTALIYECIDILPGTIRASLTEYPEPCGRFSLLGGMIGHIKVIP